VIAAKLLLLPPLLLLLPPLLLLLQVLGRAMATLQARTAARASSQVDTCSSTTDSVYLAHAFGCGNDTAMWYGPAALWGKSACQCFPLRWH
jgi:hypothetical protein